LPCTAGTLSRMDERNLRKGDGIVNWGAAAFWRRAGLMLSVHPSFHPLPGLTHFSLSCQRKVSKRKARPRWRLPLEFMSQRGEGKNSLRSDSFPSFFLSATEIQGAI
ncbi:hypothetical protein, partial [Ralstonia sp. GX3-BWBA]|uniref:hypothetical protein n=1 Tax=Ralstonia sp. GX3-BWBA TaxID=2219865 RepID=UPI001EF85D9A